MSENEQGRPWRRNIGDTTRNLVEAVLLDVWPRAGAIVDFGLRSQEHYEALYYLLRHGDITPEQVDAALGNGRKLTELVGTAAHNPHKGIVFRTDRDELKPPQPSPSEIVAHEKRQHAAEHGNGHEHRHGKGHRK
jgi:hypothetical protein